MRFPELRSVLDAEEVEQFVKTVKHEHHQHGKGVLQEALGYNPTPAAWEIEPEKHERRFGRLPQGRLRGVSAIRLCAHQAAPASVR